jgi:DNA (cytosine-5)-methyltransferase 1
MLNEPKFKNFINRQNLSDKKDLMDWLGIHYEKNIYYEGNHCPTQILRNCVHPLVGEHIFNCKAL